MIDGMLSQAASYDLAPVTDESVEGFLRSQATASEYLTIFYNMAQIKLGLKRVPPGPA